MMFYNDRRWLNKADSPSTGSFVAFDGPDPWKEQKSMTFVEIADCNEKVRLHTSPTDTKADFIDKLITLVDGLQQFIQYLQEKEGQ